MHSPKLITHLAGRLPVFMLALACACAAATGRAAPGAPPPPPPATKPPAKTPALPPGVTAHRDLVYGEAAGVQLTLDLFTPDSATPEKPLPLIIWVHGGGWRNQSKASCLPLRVNFMARGYAVASVGYRLSGVAKFPAQIQDCKAAVRWLRANAAKYNLDPARFGAWGSSAGGHLVTLLGVSSGARDFDTGAHLDASSAVQAVADYYGPVDFTEKHVPPDTEKIKIPVAELLGGPVSEKMELAAAASPLGYATKARGAAKNTFPPLFIIHGTDDPTVNVAHAKLMHEAMLKAGASSKLKLLEGAKHGGKQFSEKTLLDEIDAFFAAHLKPPPGAPRPGN